MFGGIVFHLTSPEATLGAGIVATLGYVALMIKQKPIRSDTRESAERLVRMETRLDDFVETFQNHTADDARNFQSLRDAIASGRSRRQRFGLGLLGALLRLFL